MRMLHYACLFAVVVILVSAFAFNNPKTDLPTQSSANIELVTDRACCQPKDESDSLPCEHCASKAHPESVDRKDADEFMLMMQGMAGVSPESSNWVSSKLFEGFISAPMPCCGTPGSKAPEDEHSCCVAQREAIDASSKQASPSEKAITHFDSQFGPASQHGSHFAELLKRGIAPSKKYTLPSFNADSVADRLTSPPAGKLSYSEWIQQYSQIGTVPLPGEYQRYLASSLDATVAHSNALAVESTDEPKLQHISVIVESLADVATPSPPENTDKSKHFEISAISVDIVYNRFGGHDPRGMIYVLEEDRERVLAGSSYFNAGHDPLFFGCGKHDPLPLKDPVTGTFKHRRDENGVSTPVNALTVEPLIIRANVGDTIVIDFKNLLDPSLVVNDAQTNDDVLANLHIRGAAYSYEDSAKNEKSVVKTNGRLRYTVKIPDDAQAQGTYYFHSRPIVEAEDEVSPGVQDGINRMISQVAHGLFGALIVEPKGSRYFDCEYYKIREVPEVGGKELEPNQMIGYGEEDFHPSKYEVLPEADHGYREIKSGWGAIIVPGDGTPPFREYAILFHDNLSGVMDGMVERDPKAINYRTEPFQDLFNLGVEGTRPRTFGTQPFASNDRSMAYSAYTYGDSSTPHPRFYVGDRMCYRVVHAGMGDQFHVFHHHTHRWRFQPRVTEKGVAANETTTSKFGKGFEKKDEATGKPLGEGQPDANLSTSTRVDSQTLGPAETFDVFMEGGAGGVQRSVGDVLLHCHIINHVTQGMWTYCRIYNTLQLPTSYFAGDATQPGLAPLPSTPVPPIAVDWWTLRDGLGLPPSSPRAHAVKPVTGPLAVPEQDPLGNTDQDLEVIGKLIASQLPQSGLPIFDEKGDGKSDVAFINRADRWSWSAFPEPKEVDSPTTANMKEMQYLGEAYDLQGHGFVHFGIGFPTVKEGAGARDPRDAAIIGHFASRIQNDTVTNLVRKLGAEVIMVNEPDGTVNQAATADATRKALLSKSQFPLLKFNPVDGRLAYPHMKPYAGRRPPFAPKKRLVKNGTSFTIVRDPLVQGTPFLGPTVGNEGRMANSDGTPSETNPIVGTRTGGGLVPEQQDRSGEVLKPNGSVKHYDIVAIELPIDYSTHTGYHTSLADFGNAATPLAPKKDETFVFEGKGVSWIGIRNGAILQSELWVAPGSTIQWEIPDPGQEHGVVFLNGPLARQLFENSDDFGRLVPQPRFASDGDDPIGVDPVKATNANQSILQLKLKEAGDIKVPLEPIEFICNVHGVVMKGAIVFEPASPEVDKHGRIFALRDDVPDIMSGKKPAEPLVIRANAGDVVDITLTSALLDLKENRFYSKTGIHTHLVQYDVQGSDGAVGGLNYETSIRPSLRWDANTKQLVPIPIAVAHEEQVHYRWYCDTDLGTVYFHDHSLLKDNLPHGLFGANVVEPEGSRYVDPTTGRDLYAKNLGRITSSRSDNGLVVADIVRGDDAPPTNTDFREFVPLFNDVRDSISLRRSPITDRIMGGTHGKVRVDDPSNPDDNFQKYLWGYNSFVHGDPVTRVWRAYEGDPFRIRTEGGGTHEVHSLRVDGHRFSFERGNPLSTTRDFGIIGVSEGFTFNSQASPTAGDFLYGGTGENDLISRGKWGLLRVLEQTPETISGRASSEGFLVMILDRAASVTIPREHRFIAANGEEFEAVEETYVSMSHDEFVRDADGNRKSLFEHHRFKGSTFIREDNPPEHVWVLGVKVRPVRATDRSNLPASTPFATDLRAIKLIPELPESVDIGQDELSIDSLIRFAQSLHSSPKNSFADRLEQLVGEPTTQLAKDLETIAKNDRPLDLKRDEVARFIKGFFPKAIQEIEFEPKEFENISLSYHAQQLVANRFSLVGTERQLFNRLLLESAYPDLVTESIRRPSLVAIRNLDAFEAGLTPLLPLPDRLSAVAPVIPPTETDEFYVVALGVHLVASAANSRHTIVGDMSPSGTLFWKYGAEDDAGAPVSEIGKPVRVSVRKKDIIEFSSAKNPDVTHGIRITPEFIDAFKFKPIPALGSNDSRLKILEIFGKTKSHDENAGPQTVINDGLEVNTEGAFDQPDKSGSLLAKFEVLEDLDRPIELECSVHFDAMKVRFESKTSMLAYVSVDKAKFDDLNMAISMGDSGIVQTILASIRERFEKFPEPLVLRSRFAPNKKISVHLLNALPETEELAKTFGLSGLDRWTAETSITPSLATYDVDNYGASVGTNDRPDKNNSSFVKHHEHKTFTWTLNEPDQICLFRDTADPRHQTLGLFGAIIVEKADAKWEPSFAKLESNASALVTCEDKSFREFVLFLHDKWVTGTVAINYQSARGFQNNPPTPTMTSLAGEDVVVRVVHAAGVGGFENQSFFIDERRWPFDFKEAVRAESNHQASIGTVPGAAFDLWLGKNPPVKGKSVSYYGSGTDPHLRGGAWGQFIVLENNDEGTLNTDVIGGE